MNILSVVVPVYCNAGSLPELHREFVAIEPDLATLDLKLQLIFVDDGSVDDSFAELMKIKGARPDAKVVKLTRNFGAIAALKTGLDYVEGDCFTLIAADLQDPVDRIVEMARHWREGAKLVLLARRNREDDAGARAFAWLYYRLVRVFLFRDFPERGFDVAFMDKAVLRHLKASGKNVNPSLLAYYLGYKPVILHYDRAARRHGRSMWSFAKRLKYFLDSILGFSITPLRTVSAIGLLVALGSGFYTIVMIASVLFYGSPEPGFPTLAVLVSFLTGMNLFVTGVVGEYVWRVFDEVNKRPEAVVDEVY
jgi:dolichol-phosphate mannosyltransferase